MNRHVLTLPLVFYLILVWNSAFAVGDPVKGKGLYASCAACHGQNGEGLQATNSPRLSGLQDWYLLSQLQKFRSGLRGANPEDIYGMQMAPMAKALPNEQALLDVVAYIGTLKASRPPRTEMTGDPKRGAKLYPCAFCHGTKAQGMRKVFKGIDVPRLAGQHDWYLIRQIQNFKAGIRGANLEDKAGLKMRTRAMSYHDDQLVLDIVAYITTLE